MASWYIYCQHKLVNFRCSDLRSCCLLVKLKCRSYSFWHYLHLHFWGLVAQNARCLATSWRSRIDPRWRRVGNYSSLPDGPGAHSDLSKRSMGTSSGKGLSIWLATLSLPRGKFTYRLHSHEPRGGSNRGRYILYHICNFINFYYFNYCS